MRRLVSLNDQVQAIVAPRDGYVAALGVKEGEAIEDPVDYWLLDKGWSYDYEGAVKDLEG